MKEKGTMDKTAAQIREMQQRAEQARKQARELRATAPGVALMNPTLNVPRKQLIAKHAKADGFKGNDDPGGMHYMFGDRELTDQYPDMGYEPVLTRGSGNTLKQETWHGDPMWKIPTDLYQARLEENAQRSRTIAERAAQERVESDNRSGVSQSELQTARVGTAEADRILREAGVS